jgi:hypothetical protein
MTGKITAVAVAAMLLGSADKEANLFSGWCVPNERTDMV